jgi:hypothetical protein
MDRSYDCANMRVSSIDTAPAEMVGEPRSICALHQLLQPEEVLGVGLLCRAEIHPDAVLHDFVLIEYLIQNVQRQATPSIMKFSEIISNQSTTDLRERIC